MGRKTIKKIIVDRDIFIEILKERGTSIQRLSENLNVSDKTIRRAFSTGINPDLLEKIGEKVDVDPEWLSGNSQKRIQNLFRKQKNIEKIKNYLDWRSHPFDKLAQERKRIDMEVYIKGIMEKLGVNVGEYDKLYNDKAFLEKEICVMIQVAIIHNLYDLYGCERFLDPFLTQPGLVRKVDQLLKSKEYNDIFDTLVVKAW